MRIAAALVLVCVAGCAHAQRGPAARGGAKGSPPVVLPPRGAEPASDLSRGGSEKGDVELALGAVTGGVAAALIGVGSYEAWRAVQVRDYCQSPASFDDANYMVYCTTPLGGDPFVTAIVSSSLSLAFSLPVAVASGLLLRRGVLTRRAWQKARGTKLSVAPWSMGQQAGGLRLRVDF
jgi:hypothetical protein